MSVQDEIRHMDELCHICGERFWDDGEGGWDNRHSDFDGSDIHSMCCDAQGSCSRVPFHPYNPPGVP